MGSALTWTQAWPPMLLVTNLSMTEDLSEPQSFLLWDRIGSTCLPHPITVKGVKLVEVNMLWGLRVSVCHYYCDLDEQLGPSFPLQRNVVLLATKSTPCSPTQPFWGRVRTVVAVNSANMGCNIVNYHLFCSLDEKNKCNYTHECWKMKQSNVDRHIRGAFPNEKLCAMNANGLPLSCSLAYVVMCSFWIKGAAVPSALSTVSRPWKDPIVGDSEGRPQLLLLAQDLE